MKILRKLKAGLEWLWLLLGSALFLLIIRLIPELFSWLEKKLYGDDIDEH